MRDTLKKGFSFFFNRGKWNAGKSERFRNFVALGDSIVSDDYPGPDSGAASLLHRNKDLAFPEFRELDLKQKNPNLGFQNLTKTGWMFPDLQEQVKSLRGSQEQTLIMICAGGNDLLHAYGEGLPMDDALASVDRRLRALREEVKKRYPDSLIRILNVYDPTDGTGLFQSGRRVPEGPEALVALNSVIRDVAGAELVDIHTHFRGHGMRHDDSSFDYHHPSDPSGWFKLDIEPNPRGAHEVRRKIWESIQ